jgi:hypothetical protein
MMETVLTCVYLGKNISKIFSRTTGTKEPTST